MILGQSQTMRGLLSQIGRTVGSDMSILLLGETGTGKELFARLIHASGPACRGPFIAVNCAAIPGELLEAELFGVQRHVATGVDPRPGLFAEANGGTILLDEIGEMPDRMQAKLLRVLQEREVLPVGASTPKKIDVHVIATSNRDLLEQVEAGQFRADLYYRLRGLQFQIPPLRERKDDIPGLVLGFIERAAQEYGKRVRGVTRKALQLLLEHDWPGNVRELESEIRRAVLVCTDDAPLTADHLSALRETQGPPPEKPDQATTLQGKIDSLERREIEAALRATHGNHSAAARLLGITRNGLAMKIKRLQR
jgi:transcriptional regulator with PAS, ATPase and Fis domain